MARDLKLGLNTGYWMAGPPPGAAEAIAAADELEYDSIWTAEAYGSDALTPLAWWGSATKNVRLGTAIMQIPARKPTSAAHTSAVLTTLLYGSGGPEDDARSYCFLRVAPFLINIGQS